MTLWSRIRSFFGQKRLAAPPPLVRITDSGFAVVDATTQSTIRTVRWADVSRIQTYKLDLITTDCVCMLFESRSGEPPVQISEEWPGFADLYSPLSKAFPSIPQNWYFEVTTPAFEEKRTVLYEASGVQSRTAV